MPLPRRRAMEWPRTPGWLVTYADLVSLVLAFFVLLVSFSEVQRGKLVEAVRSIQGAMGEAGGPGVGGPAPSAAPLSHEEVERLARRIQERLLEQGRDRQVRVEFDGEGGLRIVLPCRILFEADQAELRRDPETQRVLRAVTDVLAGVPGAFFEVRGHTDARTRAESDGHELSFARALAVARSIGRNGSIAMERFEVVACGAGQPVATNDTAEGQAANRRVEIHVRGALTPRERTDVREKSRALQPR